MVFGFIFALVTSGAVWMMGSDRILAVAAYDGAFPGYFGRFHARLGTPVRVNVMSGIASTIFMLAAVQLLSGSASAANTFTVVLYLATSTTLLSYLLIFPAAIKLRKSHGHVPRPYRLGKSGDGLMWVCTVALHGLDAPGLVGGGLPGHARVASPATATASWTATASPGCGSRCSHSARWRSSSCSA